MTPQTIAHLDAYTRRFMTAVLNLRKVNPEEFQRLMADLEEIHYRSPYTTWEQLEAAQARVIDSYKRENLMLEALSFGEEKV